MTTGSQNKTKQKKQKKCKKLHSDKIAVTKFVDMRVYSHKGKQKPLGQLIITSLMCVIIITKSIFPLLLGFRCLFVLFYPPPQPEIQI